MSTALTIDGDYRHLASCLHERVRDIGPWQLVQADSPYQINVQLGGSAGDLSRIEFTKIGYKRTEVRFYITHPDSYIVQLLACEQST